MIEFLRHITGLCGEGHFSILHMFGAIGTMWAVCVAWIKLKLYEISNYDD